MNDLKGKVVLVTGASSGIGAGCARAIGALGAKVAVHYNSSKSGADAVVADIVKARGEAFALQGDLRFTNECERVVSEAALRWGIIDVLINNAGYGLAGNIETVEIHEAKELFEVNVWGVVRMLHAG